MPDDEQRNTPAAPTLFYTGWRGRGRERVATWRSDEGIAVELRMVLDEPADFRNSGVIDATGEESPPSGDRDSRRVSQFVPRARDPQAPLEAADAFVPPTRASQWRSLRGAALGVAVGSLAATVAVLLSWEGESENPRRQRAALSAAPVSSAGAALLPDSARVQSAELAVAIGADEASDSAGSSGLIVDLDAPQEGQHEAPMGQSIEPALRPSTSAQRPEDGRAGSRPRPPGLLVANQRAGAKQAPTSAKQAGAEAPMGVSVAESAEGAAGEVGSSAVLAAQLGPDAELPRSDSTKAGTPGTQVLMEVTAPY